jgi:hypothetical protein
VARTPRVQPADRKPKRMIDLGERPDASSPRSAPKASLKSPVVREAPQIEDLKHLGDFRGAALLSVLHRRRAR